METFRGSFIEFCTLMYCSTNLQLQFSWRLWIRCSKVLNTVQVFYSRDSLHLSNFTHKILCNTSGSSEFLEKLIYCILMWSVSDIKFVLEGPFCRCHTLIQSMLFQNNKYSSHQVIYHFHALLMLESFQTFPLTNSPMICDTNRYDLPLNTLEKLTGG